MKIDLPVFDLRHVELFVEPVKEHRFVVIFRGEGLGGSVADTDPQQTGVPPLDPVAHDQQSRRTAEVAKQFVVGRTSSWPASRRPTG